MACADNQMKVFKVLVIPGQNNQSVIQGMNKMTRVGNPSRASVGWKNHLMTCATEQHGQ